MAMSSFKGSLQVAATADVIDADFLVDGDHLEVRSGEDKLGSWPARDLQVERRGDGVHLVLDGEDVVVNVADPDSFVAAIAPPRSRRKRPRHAAKGRRRECKERSGPQEQKGPRERQDRKGLLTRLAGAMELFSTENWSRWLSDTTVRWSIASFAVVVFALLALFATNTLGMILVLLGMIALIIAALAVSDDLTAYGWVPGNLSETTVVVAGAVAMAIGGVFIFIG